MIFFSYLKMFLISLLTGWGLGFGFWTAQIFCKYLWRKQIKKGGNRGKRNRGATE